MNQKGINSCIYYLEKELFPPQPWNISTVKMWIVKVSSNITHKIDIFVCLIFLTLFYNIPTTFYICNWSVVFPFLTSVSSDRTCIVASPAAVMGL